jgi:hypothetical protein
VLLPDHVCARRATEARVLLRNEKRWFASFSLHLSGVEDSVFTGALYFPVLPGGATIEEMMEVRFRGAACTARTAFQFSSRFPFGFAERRMQVTMRRDVIVYPALDAEAGVRRSAGGRAWRSGDAVPRPRPRFLPHPPYQPMESARHVDWRATAHTGELQVREFAREQEHLIVWPWICRRGRNTMRGSRRPWRLRVSGLAADSEQGARVRFRTQDFDLLTPVEGDVYAILRYLALVPRGGARSPAAPGGRQCASPIHSPGPGPGGERLAGRSRCGV